MGPGEDLQALSGLWLRFFPAPVILPHLRCLLWQVDILGGEGNEMTDGVQSLFPVALNT